MDAHERELIQSAIEGDREGFEMLIPLFSRKLYAIAFAVLQDSQEAEDVVQDTFFRAFKARWRLRNPEKVPAWLCTVARNRARDVWRKRRTAPLPEHAAEIADPFAPKPDEAASGNDLHGQVLRVLAMLPEHHRQAVTLHYLKEMDHASIERMMGISNGALRGILGRALANMRKKLKPALAAAEGSL